MWFRKNKIKETPKRGLYGNKYDSSDLSIFSGLSIIEKLVLFVSPSMLVYMGYIALDSTGLALWLKLIISISIVGLILMLLILLITWLTGLD